MGDCLNKLFKDTAFEPVLHTSTKVANRKESDEDLIDEMVKLFTQCQVMLEFDRKAQYKKKHPNGKLEEKLSQAHVAKSAFAKLYPGYPAIVARYQKELQLDPFEDRDTNKYEDFTELFRRNSIKRVVPSRRVLQRLIRRIVNLEAVADGEW
jgi:hypothetical protein